GSFVTVGALEPKFWQNLCCELGCEDLIPRQYDEDQDPLKARLAEKFRLRSAEDWFQMLGSKDCCVAPVRNLKDAIRDYPDAPIPRLSETPGESVGRAPSLGEHNGEFL